MDFCGRNFPDPFIVDGNRHYTNGHAIVRVNGTGNVKDTFPSYRFCTEDDVRKLFIEPDTDKTITLPKVNITWEVCPFCHGSGRIQVCPECEGDGEFEFNNQVNTYSVTCKTCNGDERIPAIDGDICSPCHGSGKRPKGREKGIDVGLQHKLSDVLIEKLNTLPGIKLYTEQVPGTPHLYYFEFDGGDGAVMSRRY